MWNFITPKNFKNTKAQYHSSDVMFLHIDVKISHCFFLSFVSITTNWTLQKMGFMYLKEYTENWVEITLMPNRQGHCPKVRQCRIFKKYSLNSMRVIEAVSPSHLNNQYICTPKLHWNISVWDMRRLYIFMSALPLKFSTEVKK